jgi:hypothetical protein
LVRLTAAVGPSGFLDLLATWLGVPTRRAAVAMRIAACQAALQDGPRHAFWSASFSKDAWSTARAALTLRDALYMAGWDGTAGADAPIRVSDLARSPRRQASLSPIDHAEDLSIYLYGYLNRVQSSRRLERETQRNVELMWLTGRLMPDFKTIANFRKDNGLAIRGACRQFIVLCRQLNLFSEAVVAVDGSKFGSSR